jgi:hypothetical protein
MMSPEFHFPSSDEVPSRAVPDDYSTVCSFCGSLVPLSFGVRISVISL